MFVNGHVVFFLYMHTKSYISKSIVTWMKQNGPNLYLQEQDASINSQIFACNTILFGSYMYKYLIVLYICIAKGLCKYRVLQHNIFTDKLDLLEAIKCL